MYTATSFGYGEDFVITPIKCPPPKIVAVKRSLKSKLKSNIMDDENDSDIKDDFINEEEDSKDLIEFEREDQPLIDLSDNSNNSASNDTLKDMNDKNSNGNSSTITMLLDLLEIGSIINNNKNDFVCKSETENCAGDDCPLLPTSTQNKSSSSSSRNFPLENPGACAHVTAGNAELSTFSSLPPQPLTENPSIVKNLADNLVKSEESELNSSEESSKEPLQVALSGIDDLSIDLERLQKLQENLQQLREKEEKLSSIFTSSGNIPSSASSSKDPSALSCSPKKSSQVTDEHVTLPNNEGVRDDLTSDKNNNEIKLDFLSPNTSQRKLPPKFYSSTNSLNRSDCFEASSRLKRLEERFKGFSYTKKLLRDSKLFSKSEEILSSYGTESEFSGTTEPLNSSQRLFTFERISLSETKECVEDKKDYDNKFSSHTNEITITSVNDNNGE